MVSGLFKFNPCASEELKTLRVKVCAGLHSYYMYFDPNLVGTRFHFLQFSDALLLTQSVVMVLVAFYNFVRVPG